MGPARILVAEDSPANRRILGLLLETLGFEAEMVEDGAKAVSRVAERAPDLVLMDCEMPVMSGYEATRALRAAGHTDLPIIAVTGYASDTDRVRAALRLG